MEYFCKKVSSEKCDLGEGLLWDSNRNLLLMTDIINGKLIELDIDLEAQRSWLFNEQLAWILPTTKNGIYLLGLESGIALCCIEKAQHIRWINKEFPGNKNCRLNDACVDSTGRVWLGSMNMESPTSIDGRLASFCEKNGLQIHDNGFTVTNGPVISPDENFLFLNDTLKGIVYRYHLNKELGKLSDRNIFIKFTPEQGYPDGMCFDNRGNLWVALGGGAAIMQIDSSGNILRKISIPALNVTNLCFCGPNLDRLIVSTASIGLTKQENVIYQDSGALFEITNHHSMGLITHSAKLDSTWT